MHGITKRFPGVLALDRVDLEVHAGEVHAVVGENGAGKSTLMKIMSGEFPPDEGEIRIQDESVEFSDTRDACVRGIAIIHQELNLFPHLTVAENISMAREPKNRFGFIVRPRMKAVAQKELDRLGAPIGVDEVVGKLRIGEQQLVEIARALSLDARVLIMDEPTSALNDTETERLFSVIRGLEGSGVAVLYISHKLEEVFRIAHRVTVLRDGKVVGQDLIRDTDPRAVVNRMVGRDVKQFFRKEEHRVEKEILSVENLSVQHPAQKERFLLKDVSFSLYKGEILGIAGLLGSGRTELLMTLFGSPPGEVASGRIMIGGNPVVMNSPGDAVGLGLAMVTEDRKGGLFLDLSVRENITIASLKQVLKQGLIVRILENRLVDMSLDSLRIKVPRRDSPVRTLSGGNQQKVVLAKWLLIKPGILLLDDPTRGIDIGAKEEIYSLMHGFAGQGLATLLVSSELPELLALSDRILVLKQGRVTGLFSSCEATEERVMMAATRIHKEAVQEGAA